LSATASLALIFASSVESFAQDSWAEPVDGWAYSYEADDGQAAGDAFASLDGTWNHENGSDQWDGLGFEGGSPGGAEIVDDGDASFLRLQETGNPTQIGFPDPGSNRKIYLGHDIGPEGGTGSILDDGATLNFRIRVPVDDPIDDLSSGAPYPESGDGYGLHNGAKANINIKQANGGLFGMSLTTVDDATGEGIIFNGETDVEGSPNVIALDPLDWNEFFISIRSDIDLVGAGTHLVTIWMNGDTDPVGEYSVTLGNGNDFGGLSYLAIGLGATPLSGALDVDFFRWAPEALEPEDSCAGPSTLATRTIDPAAYFPGQTLTVTINAETVTGTTTISDTFPDGFTIGDTGGGAVNGNTVSYEITEPGSVSYTILAAEDPGDCSDGSFVGETVLAGSCEAKIEGDAVAQNATTGLTVTRAVTPLPHSPGEDITVTLSVSGVVSETTIVETVTDGMTISDAAGGAVDGNTLTLTAILDGDIDYVLTASEDPADCRPDGTITGTVSPLGGCESVVGGEGPTPCTVPDLECEFPPDGIDAEYIIGFQFGVPPDTGLACENTIGEELVMVNQNLGANALAYDVDRGWGFEVTNPGDASRNGWGQFGPFDDSPNNRNRFTTGCAEDIYDSFIGFKNFVDTCNEEVVGSPDEICEEGGLLPAGGIFRIDLEDEGCYRFVAVIGDADNPHAHRVLVEDGGEGGPVDIGNNLVVLVNNFDQNQEEEGQVKPDCLGCGVFARIGFDDKLPPGGDGIEPDPVFVNMDDEGLATGGCPNSPILESSEGYIRIHLLQGNANVGPGSKQNGTGRDPNGGDIVMFEVWRLDDCPGGNPTKPVFRRGDADGRGDLQLTDAIFILNFLFTGGPPPACSEAADADDNGTVQLTDGIRILNFLFTGGPPPSAPGPADCGEDPEGSIDLGCVSYTACAD